MSDAPVDPVVTARLALDDYVLTVVAMQPDEWDVGPFVDAVVAAELRRLLVELDKMRQEMRAEDALGMQWARGLAHGLDRIRDRIDELCPPEVTGSAMGWTLGGLP